MNVDLSSEYLGLSLRSPLVASAGPLTDSIRSLKRLEEHGAAAVVLPSLFQEQIEHEQDQVHKLHEFATESFPESLDFFPEMEDYNTGPDAYLDLVRDASQSLEVPVIASLNGCTLGGWADIALDMQRAGADALELNVYIIPTDPTQSGEAIERRYLKLVESVCNAVSIPVAIKTGPYFSSLPNMLQQLREAGASGAVLFNRYLNPDVDLDELTIRPHLELSHSYESLLSLQWIGILYGRTGLSLAHSSGVHSAADALKSLLVGADAVMMTSALLTHGPGHLGMVEEGIREWLEEREYVSVEQAKGSMSQQNCPDPEAFLRANYMHALTNYVGEER